MNIVRQFLALLGRGLVLGVGFTAGFLLVFGAAWPSVSASTRERTNALVVAARVPTSDIVVADIVRRPTPRGFAIFGSLTNRGDKVARRVEFEIRLSRAGEVVDVCASHFEDMVMPGTTRYILLSCGAEDSPPMEHDGFDLAVTSTDWPQ